ncbi:hypothetical protein [Hasllibacter sp. MH4015]|uniref:hypothetical protein n=1 Tax=Hasllibacter sp. MH4015 TaxID=2854029 RepID=UPI001CD41352|nr:hypothetical protein [Hasllibacter sp. MH4015]
MRPALRQALIAFTGVMGIAAALFWLAAIVSGGPRATLAGLDQTLVVLFTMAHLPAMAAAILLWRDGTFRGRTGLRWALFLAMIYFSAACIVAFLGNALAASVLSLLS